MLEVKTNSYVAQNVAVYMTTKKGSDIWYI